MRYLVDALYPDADCDVAAFQAIEAQIASPILLHVRGSAMPNYFLSSGERLFNRFANTTRWSQVFMKEETRVGFLTATASGDQTKGVLARPMVADENLDYLPSMLAEAAAWLIQRGKTAVQLAAPDERGQLTMQLESAGWTKGQSWLQLVKWLR